MLGVIVLLIVIGSNSGGGNNVTLTPEQKANPSVTKSTASVPATWQLVKSWGGASAKKTEPFTITGKQWRITWSNKDTTGFGGTVFQVFVYKPGGSLPADIAVNAQEGSDVSYVYKSGEFYLDINAANGSWTIKVEELR